MPPGQAGNDSAVRGHRLTGVAGLLDPQLQVAGFLGRTPELAELLAWCADGQDAPVRLAIGPPGVGKTRLAAEFGQQMRARGWRTEWLTAARGTPELARPTSGPVAYRKSLLIVDDADQQPGLAELLATLPAAQPRTRILLLARDADSWCDQLELAGPAVHALISAARSALITLREEVGDDLTAAQLAGLAAIAFAAELGRPSRVVRLTSPPDDARPILDLHLAALVAVARDPSSAGRAEDVDLTAAPAELLRLEQHSWPRQAEEFSVEADPGQLRQLVAAACLLGAASEQDGQELAVRFVPASEPGAVTDWLRAVLPPGPAQAGWLGSLRPERIARLHVAAELDADPELAGRCLTGASSAQLTSAVRLLGVADDARPAVPQAAQRLLATELEQLDAPAPVLIAILNSLPYPEPTWARAGAALSDRIRRQLPADADQATRAYWSTSLSARYWLAGRAAEALCATEEAAAIRRELAAAEPARYLASLALSLSYLGIQYAALGRTADALAATAEAVGARRRLAAADPGRYQQIAE